MSFKFPDKDPDEKLDYTVDWSRYLSDGDTIDSAGCTWRVQNSNGLYLEFSPDKTFQFDYILATENVFAILDENVTNSKTFDVTVLPLSGGTTIYPGHQIFILRNGGVVVGLDDNIYVTAVDGDTITLSSPVTALSTDSLNFMARGLSMNSETYTSDKAVIVLSKGIANTTYRLLCQIRVNDANGVVTNREINLRVRERS